MLGGRLRRRHFVALATCLAIAVVAGASLAGAEPAPTAHGGVKTLPHRRGGDDDAAIIDGENTVAKARQRVVLHRFVLRVYANETSKLVHNRYLDTTTRGWAVQRPGPHPTFGVFPVTHSAVLGFGALPVTADLVMTQPLVNGVPTPLVIRSRVDLHTSRSFPAFVTGPVELRLTNVKVDQVPLDVGPSCRTETPIQLHLVGHPRNYNLFTGGKLAGKVTIPPFTGCGSNGDDLDPLLTGMISGPGNPLVEHQGNLGAWDPRKRNDCAGCMPPQH